MYEDGRYSTRAGILYLLCAYSLLFMIIKLDCSLNVATYGTRTRITCIGVHENLGRRVCFKSMTPAFHCSSITQALGSASIDSAIAWHPVQTLVFLVKGILTSLNDWLGPY